MTSAEEPDRKTNAFMPSSRAADGLLASYEWVPISPELLDDVREAQIGMARRSARGLEQVHEALVAASRGLASPRRPDGPWRVWEPTWLDRAEWALRRSAGSVRGRVRLLRGRLVDAWDVLRHGMPEYEDYDR